MAKREGCDCAALRRRREAKAAELYKLLYPGGQPGWWVVQEPVKRR